ncbi:uncharacterized protein FOMMEDRAFT_32007 [Fomitiporia mediterranea MF3/22]|uniref:uncharacterized protein n=1 Tax=Fomitiporia mediterranea (strain MF3/22) TaxID=694068 RepID=UPI000440949A|nr:uncharacterized protein FOMMEDRAFT_32007 [Fomitiporia mediterranea MF3/22]EJC98254.1 hypothetical protein FOMMEDRAFT_32007 [Fomitiporia mediterranea MF3/22]
MANFLGLPQDVLLKVLCYLGVDDILRMERTCKYMRETTAMHCVWLTKSNCLESASAPDLPRYLYPDVIPCDQLRTIAIKAERAYWELTRCPSPVIAYKSIWSVSRSYLSMFERESIYKIRSVKAAPGGRYLLVLYAGCIFEELQLLDLEYEGNCVWSFKSMTEAKKLRSEVNVACCKLEVFYDFDVQRDGTIAVVFGLDMFVTDNQMVSEWRSVLECVRLTKTDVLSSALEETCMVSLAEPATFEGLRNVANRSYISSSTVFCGDYRSQCTIMQLHEPGIFERPRNEQFAIFKPRIAVLSIITKARYSRARGVPFTALRAIFDPSQPRSSRWRLISENRSVPCPTKAGFPWSRIQVASNSSRSGRLLVKAGNTGKIRYGLIAIDKQGNLVFAELSNAMNLATGSEFFHNNCVYPYRRDMLLDYMEPYSGMLVALTNRGSESETIELFYPETFIAGQCVG